MKPSRRAGGAAARLVSACSLLAAAALLAACGEGDKPASQVAAKVNDEEISVHQINYVMQRQPGLKPEQAEVRSREILERLIDQELAVQKAQELKLDRDPRAVQAIEAARREILSRLYFERASEGSGKPSPEEVRRYYESKPALFAQRRIYNLQEVAVDVPADGVPALRERLEKAPSFDAFVAQLKAENVRHTVNQVSRAAEQLPMELLESIHGMKPGQAMLVPLPGGGAQAVMLAGFRDSPVGEAQARPAIEQFLANDRRRQVVEQDLKAMREQASIEYVGKFAQAGATADAAGQPAPAASAEAPKKPATDDAAVIQKGIQGLK
ncbi:EpsD family peptidyl-prolyl cis-trans isomerase [Caldimonas tepidiphila]|uniref:EpsD family peptidyl-prolyl cis-trans isomerase n=1 Tax=Caldimonas tepidiphila TaxID=2315841 RepID=UPI000E5AC482|nr:EpsD family peptidyl-prolyl cis-trans isomerase [Caldimonas tepidiphila]